MFARIFKYSVDVVQNKSAELLIFLVFTSDRLDPFGFNIFKPLFYLLLLLYPSIV